MRESRQQVPGGAPPDVAKGDSSPQILAGAEEAILALQASAGNAAVSRLMQSGRAGLMRDNGGGGQPPPAQPAPGQPAPGQTAAATTVDVTWKANFLEVPSGGVQKTDKATGEGQAMELKLVAQPKGGPDPADPNRVKSHTAIPLTGTLNEVSKDITIGTKPHPKDAEGTVAGQVTYHKRPDYSVAITLTDEAKEGRKEEDAEAKQAGKKAAAELAAERRGRLAAAQAAGNASLRSIVETSADPATWETTVKGALSSWPEFTQDIKITPKRGDKSQSFGVSAGAYAKVSTGKEIVFKIAAPIEKGQASAGGTDTDAKRQQKGSATEAGTKLTEQEKLAREVVKSYTETVAKEATALVQRNKQKIKEKSSQIKDTTTFTFDAKGAFELMPKLTGSAPLKILGFGFEGTLELATKYALELKGGVTKQKEETTGEKETVTDAEMTQWSEKVAATLVSSLTEKVSVEVTKAVEKTLKVTLTQTDETSGSRSRTFSQNDVTFETGKPVVEIQSQ